MTPITSTGHMLTLNKRTLIRSSTSGDRDKSVKIPEELARKDLSLNMKKARGKFLSASIFTSWNLQVDLK